VTTERNWLIRTTQNQILGPVAKAKVIEFLEKGALGLNDEVTSGNGFWFSLKEKDLVDKFLYGDVPQGYNPISESKSVLSKRDNPDKTTSLNTAPANKNQFSKAELSGPVVLPNNEDLEYPDLTMVTGAPLALQREGVVLPEVAKLPNKDDLEFPDITIIARPASSLIESQERASLLKSTPSEVVNIKTTDDPIVYPKEDDLVFPDLSALSDNSPKAEDEDLDFTVNLVKSKPVEARTVEPTVPPLQKEENPSMKNSGALDFKNEIDDDNSNLTLIYDTLTHNKEEPRIGTKSEPNSSVRKPEKIDSLKFEKRTVSTVQHHQPEKLLHERKVKGQHREMTKDLPKAQPLPKEPSERNLPDELKKRNDNYLLYLLAIMVLIIFALFFYYYRNILNKPLPV
jgi:hypothetical protein